MTAKKKKLVKLVKNGQAKELPKKTKAYTIKKKRISKKTFKINNSRGCWPL